MREDDFGLEPRKPPTHAVGQDLSSLSEHELVERVAVLREEIARLEEETRRKKASREAASAFFKS